MKNIGRVLTVIPAKGSSTRLRRKNLARLGGKPLLALAIENAKASGVCGEIMVSTEDEEIAAVAIDNGAKVPFLRPDYLSHDPYQVPDVCLQVLEQYSTAGQSFDTMVVMLPTCPFCLPADVQAAMRVYVEKDASFVMTVTEMDPHYYHAMIQEEEDSTLFPVFDDDTMYGRQKRPNPVRCNGAVHVVDVSDFKEVKTYYGTPLYGVRMPRSRSIDIDTEEDLAFARWRIQQPGPKDPEEEPESCS